MEDEIEIIMHANEDATEITLVFQSKKAISTEELCVELESLAHLMNKADYERNQPGTRLH